MGEKIIVKSNISDQVYKQMLKEIINGVWKEGELIPSENVLSGTFGVSRDSVRQSIHKLSALGLLEAKQGKGTYVKRIDISFYMNLLIPSLLLNESDSVAVLEFAKSIQVESTRIACRRATDAQLLKFQDYLDQMKRVTDYDEYFDVDMGYHKYMSLLTDNSLFIKALDIVEVLLREYLRDIVIENGSEMSIDQHEKCYQELIRRNEEAATRIMNEHYDMLISRVKRLIESKK